MAEKKKTVGRVLNETVSFSLPKPILGMLDKAAVMCGRSRSNMLRFLITRYCGKEAGK